MVLSPARSIIPQPYPRGSFVLPFISTAHLSACSHIAISLHRQHRQSSLRTEAQGKIPITTSSTYPYTSSITSNHHCTCSHSASCLSLSASIAFHFLSAPAPQCVYCSHIAISLHRHHRQSSLRTEAQCEVPITTSSFYPLHLQHHEQSPLRM
jgi:hypothetical protein